MREAWANAGQLQDEAIVRFILSEDEKTSQVQKEVEQHKDIVFLHVGTHTTLLSNEPLLFLTQPFPRTD